MFHRVKILASNANLFQRSRILSCFLFFIVCSPCAAEPIKPRVIGVVSALSGPFAILGTTLKNSMELANDSDKLVLKFEDDAFEPKNTVSAVRKLIEVDHIDGLVVWGTPTSLSVNEIAEKAKIPFIAISMLDKVVEGKKYVMKHWLPSAEIVSLVDKEIKKRNIKTVSLVVLANDAMLKLKDGFVEKNSAKVLSYSEFSKSESDFRMDAARIKSFNPDAVYMLIWTPQLSLFSKQLRNVGYNGILIGSPGLEDQKEIRQAEGALENAWFIGTNDSTASDFVHRYKDKYNTDPVAGGVNAYDVAKILIKCGDSPDLNTCIHTIKDFHGALGTYSATDKNDFSLKPLLKCVKDGKITSLDC